MSGAYRSFAYRVDIGVPVERVWRAFTDGRVLSRWCAEGASITPREKGRMHVVFGDDVELDAHIDVLVTPSRMRAGTFFSTRNGTRFGMNLPEAIRAKSAGIRDAATTRALCAGRQLSSSPMRRALYTNLSLLC